MEHAIILLTICNGIAILNISIQTIHHVLNVYYQGFYMYVSTVYSGPV